MNSYDPRLIRLIALFKLLKAVALIAVGVGALQLLHAHATTVMQKWAAMLALSPGSHRLGRLILEVAKLTPDKIKELVVGSFIYAGLFLTEGIGLWLVKRWAEWFTVVITCSLVPLEVYEFFRHPTTIRVLVLIINLAVVAFLLYRLRGERSAVRLSAAPEIR